MQKDETTAQLQAAGQDQDPAPKIDFNGISVLNNNISIQDEEEQRDSLVDSLLSIEAKMPENDPEDKNVNPPNPIQETGSSITFQKQELGPGDGYLQMAEFQKPSLKMIIDDSETGNHVEVNPSIRKVNLTKPGSRIKVRKPKIDNFLIDGFFVCSLNPDLITKKMFKRKEYGFGTLKFKPFCNYKLFLKEGSSALADFAIPSIFPNGMRLRPINPNAASTAEFLNRVLFPPEKQLMKNYFMISIPNQQMLFDQDKSEILKSNNPQSRAYVVGVRATDYFFKEYGMKRYGFFCDTAFCLVSKFPFFECMQKVLFRVYKKVINWRLQEFIKLNQKSKTNNVITMLKRLDFQNVIQYIKADEEDVGVSEIQREIFHALSVNCTSFNQTVSFKYKVEWFKFQTPGKLMSTHSEALAFFHPCFTALNFFEFYFILISMLEEKSVVLVSERLQLLSSVIMTTTSLLRPFHYEHPIIFSLPLTKLDILEAPVPVVCGLNLSQALYEDIIERRKGIKLSEDTILVFLDKKSHKFEYSEKIRKGFISPKLKGFKGKVKKAYDEYYENPFLYEQKDPKYWNQDVRIAGIVALNLKAGFEEMLKGLPVEPFYTNDVVDKNFCIESMTVALLENNHKDDHRFIRKLVKTQAFMEYLNKKYEKY